VALYLTAAALFNAPCVAASAQDVSPPGESERAEAGRARLPSGKDVVYRIRLLPVASFPALPQIIASQLRQKSCMVPQTYEARRPENVIRGAFEKQGSDDWAVLCSVDGATTLLVFFESHPEAPIVLRRQRDAEWLGAEIVGEYGSAWGLSKARPSQIQATKPGASLGAIDHDGIDDAFVERSSTIHYFHNGEWKTLAAGN
jgi:hypothetical protein